MTYLKDKIEAIKAADLSVIDRDFIDLIERVLSGRTEASIQAKLNAEVQLDKWYAELK